MISILKNVIKGSIHSITKNNSLLLKISCILFVVFVLTGFSSYSVEASSGIKIYDYSTKRTSTYTGKQVKVTYNGASIGKAGTPGIIVDGIALLPYTDIFKYSGIAADCVYDDDKGTIAISKYNTTIIMTTGSKKAAVNGKAVTLPVAPVKIKYITSGKVKVMVPSRFVSETLGLSYTWYSDINTVAIIKHTIQLSYNDGDKFEYSGIQGKVTIDGKTVNLDTMPSIITNNTAMLRAKKVFADSVIDADYYYNKADKTITMMKGDNVLIMTIGSKTAILNNESVKLDTAPMIVTNYETGSSYTMVPGGFTAACLGYEYTWNKKTYTSMITTPVRKTEATDNSSEADPELGDSDVANEKGTILSEWPGNTSLYGVTSNIHELSSANTEAGNINYTCRDYSNVKLNSETYMVVATAPFGKVTSSNSGNLITVLAENQTCTDQNYQIYGVSGNYINTIGTYNNTEGNGTVIKLEVLPANYMYDISFSADNMILYITVYMNSLTSAVIGKNTTGDYLTLTGLVPISASISVLSNCMYIDISDTTNGLGDVYANIIGATYINQFFVINTQGKTQIIIDLKEGYEYYVLESGNQYTVSFQAQGTGDPTKDTTDTSDNSSSDTNPDTSDSSNTSDAFGSAVIPTVTDKSRYEIVIPKPAEVATSLITHEDFYYDNYFVIRIPGDYRDFYNNNLISHNSQVVDKISVSLNNSNETVIKIATTKLQGYELAVDSDNLYVNIGNPREIYKNIVVLDPGHGGAANGAQYYGTKEKDVNLAILYTLGKKYFNKDTSKLKVYYTRTSDVDMALSARAAFAKTVGADLFISLHMNAAQATVVGSEVFYSHRNNNANSAGLSSQTLASILLTNLLNSLGTDNRGVKEEDYTVIYKNTVPAVLIELGFLSTKSDYNRLTDVTFQENTAKAIYETLLEIFDEYPTGR